MPNVDSAVAENCDTILTDDATADFEAARYRVVSSLPGGPDEIMAPLVEDGGISCYWATPGDDIVAWVGQAAMETAEWEALRTDLEANGYAQTDDPIVGTLQGERWGDAEPTLLNSNGLTHYVGYSALLANVSSLQ